MLWEGKICWIMWCVQSSVLRLKRRSKLWLFLEFSAFPDFFLRFISAWVCVCGHCGRCYLYTIVANFIGVFSLAGAYDRSSSSINNSMKFLIASFFCMRILRNWNFNANMQHKYAKLQIGWTRFLWLKHEFLCSFHLNLFTVLNFLRVSIPRISIFCISNADYL